VQVAPLRTKPRCPRVRSAEPHSVKPLRTSAEGLPDNLGGSQNAFECPTRGNPVRPTASVMHCRRRPTIVLTGDSLETNSIITSDALAIHYNGPIEPIRVISPLTCAFRTEPERPSCLTFQPSPPPPLSTAGSVVVARCRRYVFSRPSQCYSSKIHLRGDST
jgi:hypothetical protein